MAPLQKMPPIEIPASALKPFGIKWQENGDKLSRSTPYSSLELTNVLDEAVGAAFAQLVGGVKVVRPKGNALIPPEADCVEVGPVRVIGGVRPQNFDVGYRPDGLRFAFDSKTLNDSHSVAKNWQNMINDLATEATTVHSRFPHAIVAFIVLIPEPCLVEPQRSAMIETLERLSRRKGVEDPLYQAEAIALCLWDPQSGNINLTVPPESSPIHIQHFSSQIESSYNHRYKGLPPHST